MSKDTTHIRVKIATRLRLLGLIASLTSQAERNQIPDIRDTLDNPNPSSNAVSFDAAINFLIDQREKHHRRAAKSAESRRGQKKPSGKPAKKPGSNKR